LISRFRAPMNKAEKWDVAHHGGAEAAWEDSAAAAEVWGWWFGGLVAVALAAEAQAGSGSKKTAAL